MARDPGGLVPEAFVPNPQFLAPCPGPGPWAGLGPGPSVPGTPGLGPGLVPAPGLRAPVPGPWPGPERSFEI